MVCKACLSSLQTHGKDKETNWQRIRLKKKSVNTHNEEIHCVQYCRTHKM